MTGLGSSLLPLITPDPLTPEEARERRRFTCAQTLAYWATRSSPGELGRDAVVDLLGHGIEYFGACCTITDPENWAGAVAAFRAAPACPVFAWVDGQPTVR